MIIMEMEKAEMVTNLMVAAAVWTKRKAVWTKRKAVWTKRKVDNK
jgi:hypothetical protein